MPALQSEFLRVLRAAFSSRPSRLKSLDFRLEQEPLTAKFAEERPRSTRRKSKFMHYLEAVSFPRRLPAPSMSHFHPNSGLRQCTGAQPRLKQRSTLKSFPGRYLRRHVISPIVTCRAATAMF